MSFFDGFGAQDRAILSHIASGLVGLTLRVNALMKQLVTFRPEELMTAIEELATNVKNAIGLIQSQQSQIGAVSAHVETLFKENAELKTALADANAQIATLKAAAPVSGVSDVVIQDLANQLAAVVTPPAAPVAPSDAAPAA